MYLPPVQPVANSDIRICGDVEIHPSASIASGVILQAVPNSKIVIGVDACIGMGTIITASGGDVVIDKGATLGSGVLIFGQSHIGSNACVGTASTIINISVDSMIVISPGSILGDVSRSEDTKLENNKDTNQTAKQTKATETTSAKPAEPPEAASTKVDKSTNSNYQKPNQLTSKSFFISKNTRLKSKNKALNKKPEIIDPSDPWAEDNPAETELSITSSLEIEKVEKKASQNNNKSTGKVYIDQLLVTLFPHKRHLNKDSVSE